MSDIYMRILLSANSGSTLRVINDVAAALGKGNLGGALLDVGVAVGSLAIGLGVEAVKAAGDFQTAMLSNVAHAGLAKSQFDAVSQSVLQMAPAVGRAPTQLAEALYPILSAFSGIQNQSQKAALSLSTLRMSFEAVAGTTVDGTAVANAAVGTFNALGYGAANVTDKAGKMKALFDIMDLTVQQGNMQWDAYKNVISKLAVSIQGTSVTFTEASSALATLTNEGYSAQKAQTYLSNMFTTMAIKTDALAKHAAALKINFDEQKYSAMSLADKIAYLNLVTDGNKQKILALLGGNATALKAFNALSTGIGAYKSNLDALNHAHGALAQSFATASQGEQFQASQMKAAWDVLLVTLGTQLLPVLSGVIKQITPLILSFTAWITKSGTLQQVTGGLGTVIAKVKDILPYVWAFMTRVGKDIHDNLLPPAESLISNVETLVTNFSDWMDSSGAAQGALDTLGWAVDTTSQVVGTLIGWVSGLVGWLGSSPGGQGTLVAALTLVGSVMLAIKIVEFIGNVQKLAGNVFDASQKFLSFANDMKGQVADALDFFRGKSSSAATAVASIGPDAETAAGQVTTASTTMEADLTTVGTDAGAAAGEVEAIGTEALVAKGSVMSLLGALGMGAAVGSWLAGIQNSWDSNPQWIAQQRALWKAHYPNLPYPAQLGGDGHTPSGGSAPPSGGLNNGGADLGHGYASGIENFSGGLAYVHGGEVLANLAPGTSVIPANRVSFGGAGGGGVINNIYVSATAITQDMLQELADHISQTLSDTMRTQFSMFPTLSHN